MRKENEWNTECSCPECKAERTTTFDGLNYEKPTDQRQVEGRLNRTSRSGTSFSSHELKMVAWLREQLAKAYLAGFNASGEGYNGEYPFQDKTRGPDADADWCARRDQAINEILEF